MATGKRKHTRKILNKNIFDEIVNDEIKEMPVEFNLEKVSHGDAEDTELNIESVIEFYHKRLYENPEALKYLDKLGLKKKANYERFKIGFSDGSLINILSKKQKKELKKLDLLEENEAEFFKNCIIFPIFNDSQKVSSIYLLA